MTYRLPVLIVCLHVLLAGYFAYTIPETAQIPVHFSFSGSVDNYSGKWLGIFLLLGINVIFLLIMILFPRFSVRYQENKARFDIIMPKITTILVTFFAAIHIYTLLIAQKLLAPSASFLVVLIGLMLILLGNFFPKVPSNFFIGIRTPWTLSSETVWRKTHRMSGVCFVLAGLMLMVFAFIPRSFAISVMILSSVLVFVFAPVVYSFVIYKKEM